MPTPSVFVMASMGGDLNNKVTALYYAGSALTYTVLTYSSTLFFTITVLTCALLTHTVYRARAYYFLLR